VVLECQAIIINPTISVGFPLFLPIFVHLSITIYKQSIFFSIFCRRIIDFSYHFFHLTKAIRWTVDIRISKWIGRCTGIMEENKFEKTVEPNEQLDD